LAVPPQHDPTRDRGKEMADRKNFTVATNVPGRRWVLKCLPMNYEQCCIDRLNRPPKAVIRGVD